MKEKVANWQCYQDAIVAIYFSFNNFDVSLF